MLNLSRPPFIKRLTYIGFRDISIIVIVFRIHLITHRTRHHHFRSHKSCLCSIYLLLYLALFRILLVSWSSFFLFGTTRFCHPCTLTCAYTPTSNSLLILPPFPSFHPLSPANYVCSWLFFLDAVSHHMFRLFLALGFDEWSELVCGERLSVVVVRDLGCLWIGLGLHPSLLDVRS